jgi:CRISPR-associated protein Cmr2
MAEYLFRASFSPVQSFIVQARKLQDLYAGSWLLSHLSKVMIKNAKDLGVEILYPKYEEERAAYPNLFMAKVQAEKPEDLKAFAEKTQNALNTEWKEIAESIMSSWGLKPNEAFNRQIDNLWQFFWSAEEYQPGAGYRAAFLKTIQKMGAAKTTRSFAQIPQEPGRKCDLAPEYNALFCRKRKGHMDPETTYELPDFWRYDDQEDKSGDTPDNKYIKENEVLSGIAFVKRSLGKAAPEFNDRFPDIAAIAQLTRKENIYYALVQFDGDNMGSLYTTELVKPENLEKFQIDLSDMVSRSSHNMPKLVNMQKKNGVVIYAGGDDFLGAMNLDNVFQTLQELRTDFQHQIPLENTVGRKATFSAGIVIAHIKTPLGEVLRWARESEGKAKAWVRKDKTIEKDAYCLTILKHSGEITQYCHGFSLGATDGMIVLQNLIDTLIQKDASTGFIYQLAEEFERIDSELWAEMLDSEAKRILGRSEISEEHCKTILKNLKLLLAGSDNKDDFINLLLSLAFIARQRGGA